MSIHRDFEQLLVRPTAMVAALRSLTRRASAVCVCSMPMAFAAQAQLEGLSGGAFGEGLSSPSADVPVLLEHRFFTASDQICETVQRFPVRLEALPKRIVLSVGQQFSLSTLIVIALDVDDQLIENLPIAASIWYERSALRFDTDQRTQFVVVGVREGEGGVDIRSLCGEETVQISIPVLVLP